jgi:tRNA threonylcarbamoyladenosine biosynthesis protein TsaB
MLILALDTATDAVSAAVLATPADRVLGRASFAGPVAHGEQVAEVVARALAQAAAAPRDLAAVGVGRGPGPFTGLRVGLVHAAVLGWALGIPVHGVCTLDVLAAQAAPEMGGEFLVATDARRREVYWARYAPDGTRLLGPLVDAPGGVPDRGVPAVGTGAARYAEQFPGHRSPTHPDPGVLARLVAARLRAGVAAEVAPMYLRRPDAVAATTRKRVTPG